jgi:hypothetical protein
MLESPYRQGYKSDIGFSHVSYLNLNDCPAKQTLASYKGIFYSKLFNTKGAALESMAATFILSLNRPPLDA